MRGDGTMTPTHLYGPAGFDPLVVLRPELQHRKDYALYFLDFIIRGAANRQANGNGFVQVKADYMRGVFPCKTDYPKVRDDLVESGWLVCDGQFIKGEKSFGYKIGEEYGKMRPRKVEVTTPALIKKIHARRHDRINALGAVHRHLLHHLRGLEIDYGAALDALLCGDRYEPSDETAIQLIRDEEFGFIVCPFGRVHTNLTNLKSDMRRFLTYRGQSLVNLDIRNSQPLFFAVLLKGNYQSQPMPDDVRRYIDLVQEGKFYDHLMDAAGVAADGRAAFKRTFFGRVFFCENDPIHDSARMFEEEFPNVYAVIRSMKAADYCALAHKLQRAESDLMIGKVAKRIMDEMPDAFIATIHDSVVTTPDHAEAMKAIMLQEFSEIGLNPTINVELLKPLVLPLNAN